MRKLESLISFNENSLNKEMMSKIKGGTVPQEPIGDITAAGSICVSTAVSASGCRAYASDYVCCGGEYFSYNFTEDVNQPC